MASLGGKHKQAGSGREITYWCTFGELTDESVVVLVVLHEGMRLLCSVDIQLPPGPAEMPTELRIRSTLMSYIDRTEFGDGTLPDPRWIGWRPGAFL